MANIYSVPPWSRSRAAPWGRLSSLFIHQKPRSPPEIVREFTMTYTQRFDDVVLKAKTYILEMMDRKGGIFVLVPKGKVRANAQPVASTSMLDQLGPFDILDLADSFSRTLEARPDPWQNTIAEIGAEAVLNTRKIVAAADGLDLRGPLPDDIFKKTGGVPLRMPHASIPLFGTLDGSVTGLSMVGNYVMVTSEAYQLPSTTKIICTQPVQSLPIRELLHLADFVNLF